MADHPRTHQGGLLGQHSHGVAQAPSHGDGSTQRERIVSTLASGSCVSELLTLSLNFCLRNGLMSVYTKLKYQG